MSYSQPHLQLLTFGYYFNQPTRNVVWPASLQLLTFAGCNLNWPIEKCSMASLFFWAKYIYLQSPMTYGSTLVFCPIYLIFLCLFESPLASSDPECDTCAAYPSFIEVESIRVGCVFCGAAFSPAEEPQKTATSSSGFQASLLRRMDLCCDGQGSALYLCIGCFY